MISYIFLFFSFLANFLFMQALLESFFKRAIIMDHRIESFIGTNKPQKSRAKPKGTEPHFIEIKLKRPVNKLKDTLAKKISPAAYSDLERKLRDAGLPYSWSPVDFRLVQLLAGGILFTICFLFLGKGAEKTSAILLLAGAMGGLGYYYPQFYLSVRKKRRLALIQKTLADFFDMINLSVEAGMGLDAAIIRVCKTTKGPLSDEFFRAQEEMRLGKSRREAFAQLRNRVPLTALQSIMTTLIQADQLGLGISKVLRTLTDRIREHQRQLAREKAMKAPIKMLFPMLLFIFPAIFVILLGPLIIYLIQYGL